MYNDWGGLLKGGYFQKKIRGFVFFHSQQQTKKKRRGREKKKEI